MRNPRDMTPEERLARIGEILYKGICLVEMEKRSRRINASNQDGTEKKEYTLTEVAEYLSVSKRTIQRWVRRGRLLPVRKMNGHLVISLEQVNSLKSIITSKFG